MSRRPVPENERFCKVAGCGAYAAPQNARMGLCCRYHYREKKRIEAQQKRDGVYVPNVEWANLPDAEQDKRIAKARLIKAARCGGDICDVFIKGE